MHDQHSHDHTHTIDMPTSIEGLPEARRPEVVELSDGDEFELEIVPVKKQIGEATVRMLAYNGSVPGPTLKVPQGSTITVHVANRGDMDATVHWHGIRVENRFDGTHETQAPIPVGETFTYEVTFPDPGAYWYHPHIREDYGQELGLYGNLLVVPSEADYWPSAHRELLLTLDDVLIEEGRIAAFSESEPTHVAMGRFGNTMLVAGESDLALEAKRGEVIRFYFTNTANTRVFNVTLPGARMKLVGADSGHYEREEFVEEALLAPSERVVIDVLFEEPGELALEHRTPEKAYRLATIRVKDEPAAAEPSEQFNRLRIHTDLEALRKQIAPFLEAPADKSLSFVAEMDEIGGEGIETGICACPMHTDIVASWPGKCPKCSMKLMPAPVGDRGNDRLRLPDALRDHGHLGGQLPEVRHDATGDRHWCRGRLRRGYPRRECPACASPWRPRPPPGARHRVGRRHGRGQPDDDASEHALEARRPGIRRREC